MRISKFLISAFLFWTWPGMTAAQDYKIGTLDVERVLEESPQTQAARRRIDKEFSPRNEKLVEQEKEIRRLETAWPRIRRS